MWVFSKEQRVACQKKCALHPSMSAAWFETLCQNLLGTPAYMFILVLNLCSFAFDSRCHHCTQSLQRMSSHCQSFWKFYRIQTNAIKLMSVCIDRVFPAAVHFSCRREVERHWPSVAEETTWIKGFSGFYLVTDSRIIWAMKTCTLD